VRVVGPPLWGASLGRVIGTHDPRAVASVMAYERERVSFPRAPASVKPASASECHTHEYPRAAASVEATNINPFEGHFRGDQM
jgi:hypothetical protein